ncbi:sporulation membrane protein YtaF [Sporosarcina sp. YIM B06819]|uniref:sporulation membrane protein YtaF n=1 Tax=Sporosarcina sp. YIM B06819 TaxID=3081769 RepID=UPI00298D087A|nr:sporulation membrane protein YtaF [Sporosarcina sp. YIM B06819]
MVWLLISAFAVSSSIDNLGVGMSYGIRKIDIRFGANLLMAFTCFIMSIAGITFGVWLSSILPGMMPVIFGAVLLIVIGIRIILLAKPRHQESAKENNSMTDIFKNPEAADIDKSGDIGLLEAVFLGIALSANALTNGLGAGLLGLSAFTIAITAAICSFISMWAGVRLGSRLAAIRIGSFTVGQFGTVLSGVIILIIAITAFCKL